MIGKACGDGRWGETGRALLCRSQRSRDPSERTRRGGGGGGGVRAFAASSPTRRTRVYALPRRERPYVPAAARGDRYAPTTDTRGAPSLAAAPTSCLDADGVLRNYDFRFIGNAGFVSLVALRRRRFTTIEIEPAPVHVITSPFLTAKLGDRDWDGQNTHGQQRIYSDAWWDSVVSATARPGYASRTSSLDPNAEDAGPDADADRYPGVPAGISPTSRHIRNAADPRRLSPRPRWSSNDDAPSPRTRSAHAADHPSSSSSSSFLSVILAFYCPDRAKREADAQARTVLGSDPLLEFEYRVGTVSMTIEDARYLGSTMGMPVAVLTSTYCSMSSSSADEKSYSAERSRPRVRHDVALLRVPESTTAAFHAR